MEMLVPITFFLCVTAVLILRPITKRIGFLLEQVARNRRERPEVEAENAALRLSVEHLSNRLHLIEDRLDFTERLISVERTPAIARARRQAEERASYVG
jgi:regulator of replication initiation timing